MKPATVKAGPAMTQARAGQAAVRLADGRVLMMGGTIPFTGHCEMACTDPATATVEVYDPGTGKFSPAGSLAQPRTDGQALLLHDGRVLVTGGSGSWSYWLNTIEIYDPARETSSEVKPPADQKLPFDPTVVLLSDGRALIAGGSDDPFNNSPYPTSNVTLIFDPASGGFSNGPLMATARQGATATLLYDGRVLIAGGEYDERNHSYANYNVEVIDPSRPLSQSALSASMYPETSTLLSDGRVLVAERGAYDSGAGCVTPVAPELFDPRTGSFTPVGPMRTPRTGSTAIKIQDGRVLFFGGEASNCVAVGTVEAFDPDSGTFQVVVERFPDVRIGSLTLLDDGELLVAGIAVGDSRLTAATWLLRP